MTTERYVKRHINKSDYRGVSMPRHCHCICVDTHSMVSHRDASIAVICLDFGRIGCTQHENALSLKKASGSFVEQKYVSSLFTLFWNCIPWMSLAEAVRFLFKYTVILLRQEAWPYILLGSMLNMPRAYQLTSQMLILCGFGWCACLVWSCWQVARWWFRDPVLLYKSIWLKQTPQVSWEIED